MKRLTIGMPVFNDYDGVFFTVQALKLYHLMDEVELLVVDGNPFSEHGQAVRKFCQDAGVRYVEAGHVRGSAPTKGLVFDNATTPYVMCMDCHVLLAPGAVARLLEYLEHDDGDLLQGPLIYDDLRSLSTHMDMVWRGGMWGIWATDERGKSLDADPFEIPAQGMGVFVCRRDIWPGFNPKFQGFGAEECYIHEKFRRMGKCALCLPFLRWSHRFGRPGGIPYQCYWEDRIFNYYVGHLELGLDVQPVTEHFNSILSPDIVNAVYQKARACMT